MDDVEWNLLDREVLMAIWLTLSRLVAHNVIKEMTIVYIMATLSCMYENPPAKNTVHLLKKLLNLKIAKGTFVT